MPAAKPGARRLQILQVLARMLESPKGEKVTTAALAKELDVSEAALYRHFASKAQMFEGLGLDLGPIGGKLGLVLLIPFVYNMDQLTGAVFLCAMHAVVHTGGSIPSILIGVPGDGPAAATALDGWFEATLPGRVRPCRLS